MKTITPDSPFAAAVREFNQAFAFTFNTWTGAKNVEKMIELATLRGRQDIAKKLAAFAKEAA